MPVIRKFVLLVFVIAILLAAGAPVIGDGCNPAVGDACEMPAPRERWTDVDYLPLIFGSVAEAEMTRP